jgi:hypothetical protein
MSLLGGFSCPARALIVAATFAGGHVCDAVAAELPEKAAVGGSGTSVSVPYVTTRRARADASHQTAYGGERGPAGFGRCEVVFTPIPVLNQIAPRMPFYVADETQEGRPAARTPQRPGLLGNARRQTAEWTPR